MRKRKRSRWLARLSLKWKSYILFAVFVTLPTLWLGQVVLQQLSGILREQFMASTERNLDVIVMNLTDKMKAVEDMSDYMTYSRDFRTFMMSPPDQISPEENDRIQDSIMGFATFQLMSKGYIKSISIEGIGGGRVDFGEPVLSDETDWREKARSKRGEAVWSDSYLIYSGWNESKRVLSMFRVINSYDDPERPIGLVTVRMDEGAVSALLETGMGKQYGHIFIVRGDGTVVLHDDKRVIGSSNPWLDRSGASSFYSGKGPNAGSYLQIIREVGATGWQLIALIDRARIESHAQGIKASILLILGVMVLLGLAALFGFHWTIIRPILELKKQTMRLEGGDFQARVAIRSGDEIGSLGRQFNRMVRTIRRLIDTKYVLEIRQRESELKLLQSQIDPHFLYNTLDMIRWTARLEQAGQTSQLIEALSRFFRNSLRKDRMWTTLQDELEFVRSYLELQKRRLGDGLSFTVLADARVNHCVMLTQIIQPLVENSLKHGLARRKQGVIAVRCYESGGGLRIDVLDNGSGFAPELAGFLMGAFGSPGSQPAQGLALHNIMERLRIVFGESVGFEIGEPPGGGARVSLRLPLLYNSEQAVRLLHRKDQPGKAGIGP
ncbi:cache domain-containing sensor histidine kinase [Paenibacillus residui]|uniref:Sensor histidine kinase n=1 Tax=Paenibacillus residui TaxID=629724 RepID=A0ABW3D7J1_9BACL